jgi:leader peptidase (prepilin peptidase)/N-methyltransferase
MIFLIVFFFGILGLIAGSFINVLSLRYSPEEDKKIFALVSGRSRCLYCQRNLCWFELIPIISFIFLKRKCRYCKKDISWQYPIVEVITGMVFAGISWKILSFDFLTYYIYSSPLVYFLISVIILIWLCFFGFLITLCVIDIKYYILPDRIVFGGIIFAVLSDIYFIVLDKFSNLQFIKGGINFLGPIVEPFNSQLDLYLNYLLGALLFSGFLYLIYFLTRGKAMGFGDVKLGIFIGLMLGFANGLMALGLSFVIGSIVAIISLILKKKKFGQYLPFAPFIFLGILATVFLGKILINFYLSLIIL